MLLLALSTILKYEGLPCVIGIRNLPDTVADTPVQMQKEVSSAPSLIMDTVIGSEQLPRAKRSTTAPVTTDASQLL